MIPLKNLIIAVTMICFSLPAWATWQIGRPKSIPNSYHNSEVYSAYLSKDWLDATVKRIAFKYQWKVVWRAPTHYRVLINTEISGPSFEKMMTELMRNYPLKVTYNYSKRTMFVKRTK